MDFSRRIRSLFGPRRRGQSIVETAMLLPVLLIILSGLFEFGFMFTHYLAALDATRNAARFSSDSQFDISDGIKSCATTKDFFRQTACLALTELAAEQPTIRLCLVGESFGKHCPRSFEMYDDVIVSVFSISRDVGMTVLRFPLEAEDGWSLDVDLINESQNPAIFGRTGTHKSKFPVDRVLSLLEPGAPNTGIVIVEVNYYYWHILSLPWFTAFVADPVPLHLYASWPLVSAEPTSTPKP